jgi:hypothetical protein
MKALYKEGIGKKSAVEEEAERGEDKKGTKPRHFHSPDIFHP